ncbi:ATP-binding protein [Oleidesulfovibrio sp.]|uniref:sensor histidine kinase n=1 Tax=Oleidesulfovibrio sp. TaxID=2909707 RepID=UPI003A854CED
MMTGRRPSLSRTISSKLIRWMGALGLLSALFLASFSYQSRINEFESRSQYSANIVATLVNDFMNAAYKSLDAGIQESKYGKQQAMHSLQELYPHFTKIMLVDTDNKIIHSVPPSNPGQELAVPLLPVFIPNALVSQPLSMSTDGEMGIYLGQALPDETMLVAELRLKTIQQYLAELFPQEQSLMVLTDAWGNIMAHPQWDNVRQFANIGLRPVYAKIQSKGSFSGSADFNGELVRVSAMRLPTTGWVVLHIMPTSQILTEISRQILAFVALFTTLYAMLAAAFLYELQRGIAKPLQEFTGTIKSVAMGAWPLKHSSLETYEEFHEMRMEFDNMSTALEERQAEIWRERTFVQSIIDAMPSVVVALDAQGNVTHMNRHAKERVNSELTSHPLPNIQSILPQIADQMDQLVEAIRNRTPLRLTLTSKNKQGVTVHEEAQLAPLPEGFAGGVLRVDDITQRIHMEELMIQTEKMMSVGGLAAGMAHEINNPLGAILQGTQNIRRRISNSLSANHVAAEKSGCTLHSILAYMEQRKITSFLQGIQDSGERAAAIVSNMLTFSRRSDSSPTTTNLHSTLDRTIQLASSDYDLKKKYDFRMVTIERNFASDMQDVICYPIELEQVLLNLLRNAAQSVAAKGAQLKQAGSKADFVPRISLTTRQEGKWAVIEVEDNGTGMSTETKRRIFEPFFTTKQTGQGTGLGLSVSYFIIAKNHRGSLTAESEEGLGTKFTITIPVEGPQSVPKLDDFS